MPRALLYVAPHTSKVHPLQALPTVGQLQHHTRAFYWACLGPLPCLAVVHCRLALRTALGCACTYKTVAEQQWQARKYAHTPVIFQITNSVPELAQASERTTAPKLACVAVPTYRYGKGVVDFGELKYRQAFEVEHGGIQQVVSAAGASIWHHTHPRCILCKPSTPQASCTIIHALSTGPFRASVVPSCRAMQTGTEHSTWLRVYI